MHISVYGNTYQGAYADALATFFTELASRPEVTLSFERSYLGYLKGILGRDVLSRARVTEPSDRPDLALSIGGDGTFLRTACAVAPTECPVMGLNSGHLGYLSAAPIDSTAHVVDDIMERRYITEPRTMLRVTSDSSRLPAKPYALNEVALLRQDTGSMIAVDTALDGEPLATYEADGLIIATPTGSTAYNLSAGGPILTPETPALAITPVAPHSLTMRPLVVAEHTEITLRVRARAHTFTLAIDGVALQLPVGTVLGVSLAPFVTRVVRLPGCSFITSLRSKLLWGAGGR